MDAIHLFPKERIMSRVVSMSLRLGALLVCAGCATMSNPGGQHTLAPANGGPTVRVARVSLKNPRGLQAVFEGDRQLEIRDAATYHDHTILCRRFTADDVPGMITVSRSCMDAILWPYVELPKGSHSLRLVGERGEATVTVSTHLHIGWFWANGVWFAAAPIGWAVDLASGSWTYFGSVDVAREFGLAGSQRASR